MRDPKGRESKEGVTQHLIAFIVFIRATALHDWGREVMRVGFCFLKQTLEVVLVPS